MALVVLSSIDGLGLAWVTQTQKFISVLGAVHKSRDPFLTLSRPIGHCVCLGDLLLYPLLKQTKLIYRKELGFELKFITLPTSPKQN